MATGRRQRGGGDGGGSFDSLLDTMTNVVGILVILLVVTQIGVRDAVRRIAWKLPDVAPHVINELRTHLESESAQVAALERDWKELNRGGETRDVELERLETNIERLRTALKDMPTIPDEPAADPTALRRLVEELEKQVRDRRRELAETQERLARLEASLADIPEREAPPPTEIRLPNPRPAPDGAACVWALCRYDRVAFADTAALRTLARERVEASRTLLQYREKGVLTGAGLKHWKGNRGKDDGLKSPTVEYDPTDVVQYFEKSDIGTRDVRLFADVHPKIGKERLFLEFRGHGGETAAQILSPASRYQRTLRALDPAKQYVRFLVWPDSFEVYIAARDVLETYRIPAGWQHYTSDRWLFAWDFGIKMHGEQPPAPPPTPDPNAKPAAPPPPPVVLD